MATISDLRAAAHQAMLDNGFTPDIPPEVAAEVARDAGYAKVAATRVGPPETGAAASGTGSDVQDLRDLPWSSIDNDSSRDLDQLEVAERLPDGTVRVRVAIADVDGTVRKDSATDRFAATNCTSVYTGVATFPMLPEELSTDLTSLGENDDRASVVIQFVVAPDGSIASRDVYMARVRNHAKLAYDSVGAYLDTGSALPSSATQTIQDQLHLQDTVAQSLRDMRGRRGALDLETIEAQSVVMPDQSVDIELVHKTRASRLIEDFMIAANVAMAEYLDAHGSPSIRRIVRSPDRWVRIVALAKTFGVELPAEPDTAALSAFLAGRRKADPAHFADLSLAVVKLIGPGEYAAHLPGQPDIGHFALATHDYTHSTAPNRRFADLVTQRLLKAVLAGRPTPYTNDQLNAIAARCTDRENAARKVERQVRKVAAAVSMSNRVGESFNAMVTGVNPNGTYVRIVSPPVEGRVMRGEAGLDVGDAVRVRLLSTDPKRGFIDFAADSVTDSGVHGGAHGATTAAFHSRAG
ncbi:MAG: RNB domain-containing ribonuclease [Gemmatimonadaceae bacterium]